MLRGTVDAQEGKLVRQHELRRSKTHCSSLVLMEILDMEQASGMLTRKHAVVVPPSVRCTRSSFHYAVPQSAHYVFWPRGGDCLFPDKPEIGYAKLKHLLRCGARNEPRLRNFEQQ